MDIEIQLIKEVEGKDFGLRVFNSTTEQEVAMLTGSREGELYILEGVPEGIYETLTQGINHKIKLNGEPLSYSNPEKMTNEAEFYAKCLAQKELSKYSTGGIISFIG